MRGLQAIVGLALLGAMSSGSLRGSRYEDDLEFDPDAEPVPTERPKRLRRYSEPAGPPHPTTRQQRRAMERKARKALP